MTEDEENILSTQYDLIDKKRDNVPLAQYLGDETKLGIYRKPKQIYYPFGCNASQKKAVEAALTNQVSIIQGPPGTGKTQTILNIISNLLMANNTVLVVSNNNSAVANVAEKLAKEDIGFIVAKLGSVKNKEAFIANQPGLPDMSNWIMDEKEKTFAANSLSHVDFLLYNSMTKQPLKIIEVDGWHYHKDSVVQQSRDDLKDNILMKYGLTPIRLSTTNIVNIDTMAQMIASIK